MNTRYLFLISIFILSLAGCAGYATSVHVHERNNFYELHVPASKLALGIPKNGFIQMDNRKGGGTNNPRYFYFVNASQHIILSGWFESDENYPGMNKYWEEMEKKRSSMLPPPQDVYFKNVHGWNSAFYNFVIPDYTVSRINNDKKPEYSYSAHVNAHWVQAGTWIDIHISTTFNSPNDEARSKLEDVLNSIQVIETK